MEPNQFSEENIKIHPSKKLNFTVNILNSINILISSSNNSEISSYYDKYEN